jgi:hypothetical protein
LTKEERLGGVFTNFMRALNALLYMYFIYEMRKVQMWLTSSSPIGLQIILRMLKILVVTLVSVMIALEIVANLMVALSVVNGDK